MSLHRFAGYFFALSACSTIAFASCLMDKAAPPDATLASGPVLSIVPAFNKHHARVPPRRQATLKAVLVARAD